MRNNNNDNNFEGKRRTKEAVKRIMRADLEVITSKVSPAKIKTPTIINLLGKNVTTDTLLNKSKNSNPCSRSVHILTRSNDLTLVRDFAWRPDKSSSGSRIVALR